MVKSLLGKIIIRYNKLPLWSKLFVFYALFIVTPILFVGTFSYMTSREALLNKTKAYMQKQVQIISNNINAKFNIIAQKSNIIISDRNINVFLTKDYNNHNSNEILDAVFYMERMISTTLNIDIVKGYRLRLYIDNKSLVTNNYFLDYEQLENILTAEKIKELDKWDTVWLLPDSKDTRKGNEQFISVFRKIRDGKEGKMQVLNIDVPVSEIENQLDIKDISKTCYINYISPKGEELLITDNNSKNNLKINDLIDKKKSEGSVDAKDSFVIYHQTPINNFYVVISIMYTDIYRETNKILFTTIIIMILSTLVLIPISLMISRMLTSRFYIFFKKVEILDTDKNNEIISDNMDDEISRIILKFNKILLKNNKLLTEKYNTKLQLRETENKILKMSVEQKSMELKLIQAQVDPHFIYNAFSSVKVALKSNKCYEDIETILDSLVRFYRLSLNNGESVLKVSQELELTKEYTLIQNFINNNKFNVIFEIDEDVHNIWCPKFLLQPIVENAIYHGLKQKKGDCVLVIRAERDESNLIFTISDNGVGFDSDKISEVMNYNAHNSFGLRNVYDRIKLFFGNEAVFEIRSEVNEGTEVKMIIPIRSHNELMQI